MKYLVALILIITPLSALAVDADLMINASDIRFKSDLVAGETVRIYGAVKNIGDLDVAGYVTFFQGTVPIGDSQVISVVAGGNPEEVYVDFVVPSGDFNIRAEIRGTDPEDMNFENNVAITGIFTPLIDDDRDGIVNDLDNCPVNANANQGDFDSDGLGDVCDDDADNDGLTNDVERELGTNPKSKDTDGDGVNDKNDVYPTDPLKFEHEPEPEPEKQSEKKSEKEVVKSLLSDLVNEVAQKLKKDVQEVGETEEEVAPGFSLGEEVEDAGISFSPNAIFSYSKDRYTTFTFNLIGQRVDGYVYEWDFGDGVTSGQTSVTHTFEKSGAYKVFLTIRDHEGNISTDSTTIFIPLFSLQNKLVVSAIVLLAFLLLIGFYIIFSLGKKQQSQISFSSQKKSAPKKRVAKKPTTKVRVKEE